MTDSKAIVNTMWDVSFSNLDKYEPPESGKWYVVISGEKFMNASSSNFAFSVPCTYVDACGNWTYYFNQCLPSVHIKFING